MDIQSVLLKYGYKLTDSGGWWRCQALYRGGSNGTSLSVNKKNGNFKDFVSGETGSLKSLIALTLNEDPDSLDLKELGLDDIEYIEEKPKMETEKVWPTSLLKNLFPHYSFYKDRGISEDTLIFFKSGMAHSGEMNKRYVFPIFNSSGLIHGWTGRTMVNSLPKWKHMGKTRSWIYPYYMEKDGIYECRKNIEERGFVILVESIGDMLALWDRGYKNVLVTFGISISNVLVSHLVGLSCNIVISTNNDFNKKENVGREAALDIFIKLMSVVDYKRISIALPCKANDFGEESHDFDSWLKKVESPNYGCIYKAVLDRVKKRKKKLSKIERIVCEYMEIDIDEQEE